MKMKILLILLTLIVFCPGAEGADKESLLEQKEYLIQWDLVVMGKIKALHSIRQDIATELRNIERQLKRLDEARPNEETPSDEEEE